MQSRPDTQSSEHYNQANYNPSPFPTTLLLLQGREKTAWVPHTHLTAASKYCALALWEDEVGMKRSFGINYTKDV